MPERIIVLASAFLIDCIFGDPQGMWHPVCGIGKIIEHTERFLRRVFRIDDKREADRNKKRLAGGLMVLIVLAVTLAFAAAILFAAEKINHYLYLAAEIFMCYQMLAAKSLYKHSMRVYGGLKAGNLEGARKAVSMIVGRDTENLDGEGITKAAVETVAENTSDGVTAPLIYMALFGALGAFFYKAVNTMDSMTGYKNDRYVYFGTCAARLDDIVNYIPSRITAVLMIAASFILRLDAKGAFHIYKRDRRKHKSPNSAQTESVMAGALDVRLAGNAYYFGTLYEKPSIGDSKRNIEAEDIRRANLLMYTTSVLMLIFLITLLFLYNI